VVFLNEAERGGHRKRYRARQPSSTVLNKTQPHFSFIDFDKVKVYIHIVEVQWTTPRNDNLAG
jgi:hypothetical protein